MKREKGEDCRGPSCTGPQGWFIFHTPTLVLLLLFVFLGPHPRHMEVPRLGVKSELEPPAYTTGTAAQDLSRVCNLHHSSWQCWILNPLSEARDRTCVLMDSSQIPTPLSHNRNSLLIFF